LRSGKRFVEETGKAGTEQIQVEMKGTKFHAPATGWYSQYLVNNHEELNKGGSTTTSREKLPERI
jgi:hypothetical protein